MRRKGIAISAAGRELDQQNGLNVEGHSTALTHFSTWEAFLRHVRAWDTCGPGTCVGLGHVQAITHLKRSWELCDEPHEEDATLPSQSRNLPVETEGSAGPGGEGGAARVGTVVSAVGLGVLRGRAV